MRPLAATFLAQISSVREIESVCSRSKRLLPSDTQLGSPVLESMPLSLGGRQGLDIVGNGAINLDYIASTPSRPSWLPTAPGALAPSSNWPWSSASGWFNHERLHEYLGDRSRGVRVPYAFDGRLN
jgi:hypothetical protein